MAFYVGKGLQLAGLFGVAWALWTGLTGRAGMGRELALAGAAAVLFYGGRMIESRSRG